MQEFKTARFLLMLVQWYGWIVAGLSVVGAMVTIIDNTMTSIGIGLAGAMMGIILVAICQIGIAVITTAENTGAMLALMRGKPKETIRSGAAFAPDGPMVKQDAIKQYEGYAILKGIDGVIVRDQKFANVLEAERWINEHPIK